MTADEAPARPAPAESLPPGPCWPRLVQSVALLRFRHRFVPWLHRTYGDAFTVRTLVSVSPLVLLTRPEQAREVFTGDPEVFRAGRSNAVLEPVMGRHSLLLQDTEEHRRTRALLMPAFHGAALRSYRAVVGRLAREEVARWRLGVPFRSLDRMNALTLEVILRVVFGVADQARLAELRPLVNRVVDVSPAVVLGWSSPWLQRFGPWKAAVDNRLAMDRVIYAEIAERRAFPGLADRSDVLSRLMAVGTEDGDRLTDTELRDQLVTLLLAGHETTAAALSWALHELGSDRGQLARAQAAADSGDDQYLEAVLKESMRLHPVIAMVLRELTEPTTVAGRHLPAGTSVGPSILLAHRRPESFPEPERFRPDRFLDGEVAANTWIPFGGGVRRCLGAGFSLMEGVAVLREVLSVYDLSAPGHPREVPKVRNITSVPRYGARIVVRPR